MKGQLEFYFGIKDDGTGGFDDLGVGPQDI